MGRMKINTLRLIHSKYLMRDVSRDTEKYRDLKSSIEASGLLNPITVRLQRDPYGRLPTYEVVDGNHRLDVLNYRYPKGVYVWCIKVKLTDLEFLAAQIRLNRHRVSKDQIIHNMKCMLSKDPSLSCQEMAAMTGVTAHEILNPLLCSGLYNRRLYNLVYDGHISLMNAHWLAKLSAIEQDQFYERAMVMTAEAFASLVHQRLRDQTHDDRVVAFAVANLDTKTWSPRELLHGKKEEEIIPGETVVPDEHIRKGWDKVHDSVYVSYCSGDYLVQYTGRHWAIYHPKIAKIGDLNFRNCDEAMIFVEKVLREAVY